ncbi:DEAH-box ATP-dependent RNA helicase prp22, partial [Coemansia sp. RSA 2559]
MSSGKNAGELERLEYLSLVSKVTNELSNHTGISDKDVTEYILHLHGESSGYSEFKRKLDQDECGFSEALIQTLHRLITTMKPKPKPKANGESKGEENESKPSMSADDKAALFPGLSMPNRTDESKYSTADQIMAGDIDKHIDSLLSRAKDKADGNGVDDKDYRRSHRNRSPSERRRMHRSRSRERHRSRSPRRDADSHRHARYEGSRHEQRSRDHDYDKRSTHRSGNSNPLDETPVQYKIYNGRVANLKDFGAFVSLDGVKGRVEGMVHVSAIQRGVRIGNPREVLDRGQSVKVKVLSIVGSKLGLSMKDVDQDTGEDLTPHLYPGMPKEEANDIPKSRQQSSQPVSLTGSNAISLGNRNVTEKPTTAPTEDNGRSKKSSVKRLTSPERWEIKQLIASGVLDRSDYPGLDEVDEDGMPA